MSTRGTLAPLFTASVELSNLITCHLLAERPYSAWTMLCESSSRMRRWLSLGLLQMKSAGFDHTTSNMDSSGTMQGVSSQGVDFGATAATDRCGADLTSPTNACILHLAPIHPDLGAACAQLHKSLCQLSAQLHVSSRSRFVIAFGFRHVVNTNRKTIPKTSVLYSGAFYCICCPT